MTHPNHDEVLELITTLSEHEMAIGRLYEQFSRSKPNAAFWLDLAKAEFVHHQCLTALYLNSKNDNIKISSEKLKRESVSDSMKSIAELMKKAEDVTPIAALNYALDIEKEMIEGKYFTIFGTENLAVNQILEDIKKETKEHIGSIEQEITRFKLENL